MSEVTTAFLTTTVKQTVKFAVQFLPENKASLQFILRIATCMYIMININNKKVIHEIFQNIQCFPIGFQRKEWCDQT